LVVSEAPGANPVTEVVVDGTDVHVTLTGDLDLSSAWLFARRLDEVVDTTTGTLVLNMSGVTFIDSTGISVLIAAHRQLSPQGRSMVLRDVSASTRRVLDIAGLRGTLGVEGDDAAND
jgi:anti-anti-sigma factor